MSNEPIECKLNRLADYKVQKMLIENDKQTLIDSVLTPEVKTRLSEIDTEFADLLKSADEEIINLQDEIKQDVLSLGVSVKGNKYHAIYTKGRVSWETKGLDGFAVAYPELLTLRKQGEPTVSIREI